MTEQRLREPGVRAALERLMDVALIEEEDQTAQTQDEWIAALQQARAALASDAGSVGALDDALRLLRAARACIASDFGPEGERQPVAPALRVELLTQMNALLDAERQGEQA